MKEEPFPASCNAGDRDVDVGGGGDHGLEAMLMEESSQSPGQDEEVDIDIKHEFPVVVATNPLLDTELVMVPEAVPGPASPEATVLTKEELNLDTNPSSVFYLNGYDDQDDYDGDGAQAELDEINGIINGNGGEVDVQEVKPVAIPIPIVMPAGLANSNDIIINHTKPRPKWHKAKPKPCICTICHTGFPSQQSFQLHMSEVHADKRPFCCSHCEKGFATTAELVQHETIHDPNRFKGKPKFACDLCDKKYHLRTSLKNHQRIQHLGYKKPCKPYWSKVITEHHASGVRNHQPQKKEIQVFKCPYCDLKFAMRCLVKKHLSCHSKERPYQCPDCEQRCVSKSTLNEHIKARHLNMNPSTNPRPSRPKCMGHQPCPCTVCGKVFKIPSQLQKHFLVHSGEKPHECPECGQRFTLKQALKTHTRRRHDKPKGQLSDNEEFKCLICGKCGFMTFSDLRTHRIRVHRHIALPADPDKEKPYGCGICGKPYYKKGRAMVCAILGHDPTSLLNTMFKFKCPECPEERFGYHSTLALRRHWEKEHVDKQLLVRYRAPSGMYGNDRSREDTLPTVAVNKELAKRIRENGPEVKYEFPLYTEFDLLPIKDKFWKDINKGTKTKRKAPKPKPPPKNATCNICELTLLRCNLKRHMKKHIGAKTDLDASVTANKRGSSRSRTRKRTGCLSVEPLVGNGSKGNVNAQMDVAILAGATVRRGRGHPLKNHSKLELIPSKDCFPISSCTVNAKDTSAIRSILGNRVASIVLPRINAIGE